MARKQITRRNFIQSSATAVCATTAVLGAPAIVTASKTNSVVYVGTDQYKYKIDHECVELPEKYTWQTTHNVAVDKNDNLYVIHEGHRNKKDHPSIFVFDPKGKFVRAFGQQFQGGGHGIEVREENGEEFLYVAAYQGLKNFAKLNLKGEVVWKKFAPMQSEKYAKDEDKKPRRKWGRNRFMPTNFAFHPDGGFFLADGYGAWCIHRYDKDANYMSTFGEPGKKDGQFSLPHGIWIDAREKDPTIVVADRVNARLQWFSMDGKHLRTQNDFILPANIDIKDDLMLVPDLSSRLTLLDKENKVVAQLGEDAQWRKQVKADKKLRTDPKRWKDDRFVHPHDACFDSKGNIFVAEWVGTGRVSKLTKV